MGEAVFCERLEGKGKERERREGEKAGNGRRAVFFNEAERSQCYWRQERVICENGEVKDNAIFNVESKMLCDSFSLTNRLPGSGPR